MGKVAAQVIDEMIMTGQPPVGSSKQGIVMSDISNRGVSSESREGARRVWVAPQIITSAAADTAANQLPTFLESTVPTDRPS